MILIGNIFLGLWLCKKFSFIICFIGFAYFRPEIPNLIHLLQLTCVPFSGTGRLIFNFFAPKSFF